MDALDVTDRHYDRKYQDMQDRMERLYDQIAELEDSLADIDSRLHNIRQQKITGDNVYQYLLYFDRLYDRFTDKEKKEFLNSFIDRIDIYENDLPDGRFLKRITFNYPVFCDGQELVRLSWDNETTVETAALLFRRKDEPRINVTMHL